MDASERDAWREADRLLDGLLDLPVEQREAALAAMPLPGAVAARLRKLLAAQGAAGPLDGSPPVLEGVADGLSGRRLGRWTLEREIGRGGMAVVYRAQALDGAAGQVAAVKVLGLGTLARSGQERFLAEQQALARLHHPYIASIYDAGVADDGTPWMAMSLVEGEAIDAWCRERALPTEARVRLVLQVAEALAYAHRNLVIHRDIKPSNVLVDSDGHVRLLDFGIARLADRAAERTTTALRALTPEYAAPEQFSGAAASTVMDVYGLGALLYRLLTEQPPRARGVAGGPPTQPPSRALRGASALPAAERQLRARRIRGDLDTVVMKALAERPEDRYASVEALAGDLQRWLERRPVRAHAPSWRYRTGKFLSRHRLGTAASVLLLAALGAGIAGTLWQARLARAEAARARAAAEQSQAQLVYLDSVLEVLAPSTQDDRERDRGQMLADIARRATHEFGDRPDLLATVELSLGNVAERIGEYTQAERLYGSAYRQRRAALGADSLQAVEAQLRWGKMLDLREPSDPVAAEGQLRSAVAILRRVGPDSPLLVEALTAWASKLGDRDRYEHARALLVDADRACGLSALREAEACEQVWLMHGMLAARAARPAEAVAPLESLVAIRTRRYGADHALTLFAASELGKAEARSGQLDRGLALIEEVHAQQQRIYATPTRETLRTLQDLSELLGEAGQYERALALRERYIEQALLMYGERHGDVAVGYANLGTLYFGDGRYADAAQAYRKAQDTYAALYDPRHAGAMISLGNYADALREMGRAEDALPLQRAAAAALGEQFGTASPRYASRLSNLARTLCDLGRHAQALEHYDASLAIYVATDAPAQYNAAVIRSYRSQALTGLGRLEEAEREARAARADIAGKVAQGHRYAHESLAQHARAACAARMPGCAELRAEVDAALHGQRLPGGSRGKLQAALAQR